MSIFFSRRPWFLRVGGPRRPNNIVRAALWESGNVCQWEWIRPRWEMIILGSERVITYPTNPTLLTKPTDYCKIWNFWPDTNRCDLVWFSGTYIVFRIGILAWMTRWIVVNKDLIPLVLYSLGSIGKQIKPICSPAYNTKHSFIGLVYERVPSSCILSAYKWNNVTNVPYLILYPIKSDFIVFIPVKLCTELES